MHIMTKSDATRLVAATAEHLSQLQGRVYSLIVLAMDALRTSMKSCLCQTGISATLCRKHSKVSVCEFIKPLWERCSSTPGLSVKISSKAPLRSAPHGLPLI